MVVLDIMLPGLNGYRVCSRLRACGSNVGILMLTAKDGEWDEAEALDTGADDFLSKPFSFVVLVARLRAPARRIGSRAPQRTVLGDLVVDSAARTCSRGGVPVPLTPREFAVLDHLARRAGEAVSKREILACPSPWTSRLSTVAASPSRTQRTASPSAPVSSPAPEDSPGGGGAVGGPSPLGGQPPTAAGAGAIRFRARP
ncbi:Transcriptional activator protein CopR [Streptomyces lavendulae subsp. lavendulae]|uniref:Transcriptional activator protein CopR n=1 Tax=Streptomyces lavendulae subsp. lavendulae TaxID=58340 RepID=A0A2K8P8E8_STRLA|nr:Transcriptional activator protein CopR [Streptomyces lavendulae subsp. lavendulae]QUQ52837.1 hypothetical protein SLLC_03490 [Streptomyces lavendulae subsp. lavendulae]